MLYRTVSTGEALGLGRWCLIPFAFESSFQFMPIHGPLLRFQLARTSCWVITRVRFDTLSLNKQCGDEASAVRVQAEALYGDLKGRASGAVSYASDATGQVMDGARATANGIGSAVAPPKVCTGVSSIEAVYCDRSDTYK